MKTFFLTLAIALMSLTILSTDVFAHGTHLMNITPTFDDDKYPVMCNSSNSWSKVCIMYQPNNMDCYIMDTHPDIVHVIYVPSCTASDAREIQEKLNSGEIDNRH